MKRRVFITLLGGAAAAWTVAARAQQARVQSYRIGFLTARSGPAATHRAFEAALAKLGYREGANLVIERRYAAGTLELLPRLAAELVNAQVDVIVTETTPAAVAAKQATNAIPIVMATGGDAVRSGLVASLARPGGNVTGMTFIGTETITKTVEILHELKPQMKRVAFLGNNAVPPERIAFNQLQVTARTLGMEAAFFDVAVLGGIEPAFASVVQSGMDVMSCANSPTLLEQSKQIIELAASHRLPTAYGRREFVGAAEVSETGLHLRVVDSRVDLLVELVDDLGKPHPLPLPQFRNGSTAPAIATRYARRSTLFWVFPDIAPSFSKRTPPASPPAKLPTDQTSHKTRMRFPWK